MVEDFSFVAGSKTEVIEQIVTSLTALAVYHRRAYITAQWTFQTNILVHTA